MNIWTILIECLSYTTIVAFCYTVFWGLSRHLFTKIKIYYEFFLGFVLGFISTFTIILMNLFSSDTKILELTILLPTFLYWVALIFISPFTSVGILVCNFFNLFIFSSLLGDFFGAPTEPWTITMISLAYIIPCINYLVNLFVIKISNWTNWSITTIILLSTGLIWKFSTINTDTSFSNLIDLLFWLGCGYLTYAYIAVINQTYLHALKLQNIVKYDNKYYLNFMSAHEQILNKVQENKIKHGIYLNYFISNFEKFESKVSGYIKDEVVSSISEESYHLLCEAFEDSIFFKPNYKTFGAFIPFKLTEDFDETKNIYLNKINSVFSKVNTNFLIDKYKINVKLKSVCSYFGLHSNNLDKLLEFNCHTMNEFLPTTSEKNVVVNPIEVFKEKNQNKKMLALNEVANINQFVTLFEPIYSRSDNDFVSYFLNGMINGLEINSDLFIDKSKIISDMGLTSLFNRYTAFQTLKKISKQNELIKSKDIFVNYDSDYLSSEEFDLDEFLIKIKKLGLDLDKIILNFDISNDVDKKKALEKAILKLKKHSIRTSVSNFGSLKTDFALLSAYKPDFIFLENEIAKKINSIKENESILLESIKIANKIDAKIIATAVNSYIVYKHLKSLGVEAFAGDLIGSAIEAKESISEELKFLLNK